MKYDLPKDVASLNKLIESAIRSATTMKNKVQVACVAILHHAYMHGDWTKANDLVAGLAGAGAKRENLVKWFTKYGGLTIEDGAAEFTGWSGKDHIKANFDYAKANMWYDTIKEGNPFRGYDFEAEVKRIIVRHKSMMKKYNDLSAEEQEKVNFNVNEATIEQLLHLAHFEAIIEPEPAATRKAREKAEAIAAQDAAPETKVEAKATPAKKGRKNKAAPVPRKQAARVAATAH